MGKLYKIYRINWIVLIISGPYLNAKLNMLHETLEDLERGKLETLITFAGLISIHYIENFI